MTASPTNARIMISIRLGVVLLSGFIIFLKIKQTPNDNELFLYLIMVCIMMMLTQSVTAIYLNSSENFLIKDKISSYLIYTSVVYLISILIILAYDLLRIHVLNLIVFLAGASALVSGVSGIIINYRMWGLR